jgi:hypothetical protein
MVALGIDVLLLAMAVVIATVFIRTYRQALTSWVAPRIGPELPVAVVGRRVPRPHVTLTQRFHAALIATVFASVCAMAIIALVVMVTLVALV